MVPKDRNAQEVQRVEQNFIVNLIFVFLFAIMSYLRLQKDKK